MANPSRSFRLFGSMLNPKNTTYVPATARNVSPLFEVLRSLMAVTPLLIGSSIHRIICPSANAQPTCPPQLVFQNAGGSEFLKRSLEHWPIESSFDPSFRMKSLCYEEDAPADSFIKPFTRSA